jgi:hypothetical protein
MYWSHSTIGVRGRLWAAQSFNLPCYAACKGVCCPAMLVVVQMLNRAAIRGRHVAASWRSDAWHSMLSVMYHVWCTSMACLLDQALNFWAWEMPGLPVDVQPAFCRRVALTYYLGKLASYGRPTACLTRRCAQSHFSAVLEVICSYERLCYASTLMQPVPSPSRQ